MRTRFTWGRCGSELARDFFGRVASKLAPTALAVLALLVDSARAAEAGPRAASDLALDLVLRDPVIAQPVFLNFDERGRMWIVQYRQYPEPAGLTMLSRDSVWRAVYDKKKPPPPYDAPAKAAFRGIDRITIHEDVNGDGTFAKTTTFLDGLNITTAVAQGRGGVWVLSPPHLLFYPDANRDDVPDGPPVVHLEGFNLEDTHSVANSLRWGPDGWLYGANGSTVTADITRPGLDRAPVAHIVGQAIWRYHPETRRFEVYAEGGGNAFGVEIDAQGRVFSGHNGGDTRGFHYVQGGYLRKGFGKHGELSNPHAFGFFDAMKHPRVKRFTHNFIIYDGGALPSRYDGKLIGIDPISGWLPLAEITPRGATFETRDIDEVVRPGDATFRPVDIKHGPDGAIYLADWRDAQINHYLNHEGKIAPKDGRIYRLRAPEAKPGASPTGDLAKKTSRELVELLRSPNRWLRETAQRLLADRRDAALIVPLREAVRGSRGQFALEALWALNASGGFDEAFARESLAHADPFVRLWTVRLLGDGGVAGRETQRTIVELAKREPSVEVRSQLAASAKRFTAPLALELIRALIGHDADAADPYVPLQLWWALESKCAQDADSVLGLFATPAHWWRPLLAQHLAGRTMRRFAAMSDWVRCEELLKLAPSDAARRTLVAGFEQAFSGRALPPLPASLLAAITKSGAASLALRLRQGGEGALDEALQTVANPKTPAVERARLAAVFGEVPHARAAPVLARLFTERDPQVRKAAIGAAAAYDDDALSQALVENYPRFNAEERDATLTVLASRVTGAKVLLAAVEAKKIPPSELKAETLELIRLLPGGALTRRFDEITGALRATTAVPDAELARVQQIVSSGNGSPYRGRVLFEQACAACHQFFGKGGEIGPDLTSAKRDELASLVLAIVKPGAEIREGFEAFVLTTADGAVRAGFLVAQDGARVTLRDLTGANATVERAKIKSLQPLGRSLMPEGLLTGRSDQELRDLFAYLRMTQPLVGAENAER